MGVMNKQNLKINIKEMREGGKKNNVLMQKQKENCEKIEDNVQKKQ